MRAPGRSERRVARFDGLRAVLVLAVMAHHMEATFKGSTAPVFKAGWLPVDGFFVLSGYLITTVRFRELGPSVADRIALRRFLWRRLARLLPALAVVLAVIGIVAVNVDHRPFADVGPSLLSAASYVHNYNYLRISPLLTEVGPYWTVSVEMQFYVGFAVLALVLWRVRASHAVWVIVLVTIGVAVSHLAGGTRRRALPRLVSVDPGPTRRVDVGRAPGARGPMGMVGAAAAPRGRRDRPLAVGILVWMYLSLHAFDPRTYEWGIAVSGVASAIVETWLVVDAASWAGRALSWPPLVALGRRSYSAYLWHQAVFLFLWHHTASGAWSRPVVGFAATFVLADLTYRCVEHPAIDWSRSVRVPRAVHGSHGRNLLGDAVDPAAAVGEDRPDVDADHLPTRDTRRR